MVDKLLEGTSYFTGGYIDDLIVYSLTWEEHLKHLQDVLQRIRQAGLMAKARKCQLGMTQCQYLGHIIGGGMVQPEETKIQAIKEFPIPVTKKGVRSFLGLTGYYRKFIPGSSCCLLLQKIVDQGDQVHYG